MSQNTTADSATTYSPDFVYKNLSTLVWGTDGAYSSYIVTSANESERIEEIDIENGTGFEAIVILLRKGLDVDIEVIDDTAITPPSFGSVVSLSTPFGTVNMLRIESKSNRARKREGMRTFTFKSFNAISGLH